VKNFHAENIFKITDYNSFNDQALKIFHLQYQHNKVYKNYVDQLGVDPDAIRSIEQIPFLPIELFKTHEVIYQGLSPELVFYSSGTTGVATSRHLVADKSLYYQSFTCCFDIFFGDPRQYCILALLPSYLERENSSLVHMINELIDLTDDSRSGFYLDQFDQLAENLDIVYPEKKVILFGVTFALLDLIENHSLNYPDLILIETGGMKGRRTEMIREELHERLKEGFGVDKVHSEYGMTELLSQAYSTGNGLFRTAPWMHVLVRDLHDPFAYLPQGKTGPLNIIDLANVYSCSFVATQDLGRISTDGSFEVLGRVDNSDIRGCSLLLS